MQIIKISPQGQITIPAKYRKKIKSKECLIEMDEGNIILKPIKIEIKIKEKVPNSYVGLANKNLDFWEYWEDETHKNFYAGSETQYDKNQRIDKGDVLLVPYPVDNNRTKAVRPVLVVGMDVSENLTVLPITLSKSGSDEIPLSYSDLCDGIIQNSFIRYKKPITLHKSNVVSNVAKLKDGKLSDVLRKLTDFLAEHRVNREVGNV